MDVIIYPNPAGEYLIIETAGIYSHSAFAAAKIEIINSTGQVVKHLASANSECSIDLKELNEGVYSVRIMTNKGTIVKKFIKK